MPFDIRGQLTEFLAEDIGSGDITSSLLDKKRVRAGIVTKENAVVAGTKIAAMIFGIRGCKAKTLKRDGLQAMAGESIITISGDVRDILACERTALNLLSRMSGIATQTRRIADRIPDGTKLYSTRKTAPGLRYFDKLAVEIGGGHRHRMRLDEMVLIKDNHIAAESLEGLIRKAKAAYRRFEVEVEDTSGAVIAAREGASTIMLDNFSPSQIRKTVSALERQKLRDRVTLEASGGINLRNIGRFGRSGVDIISVGCITSSVRGIDMSLEVRSP